MLKRKLTFGLALLAASLALSCGNSSTTTTVNTDTGGVVIFVTDSPACNVLTYRTAVTGIRLLAVAGGRNVNIFPGALGAYVKVNFAALKDLTTILHSGTVRVGTYNQIQISFASSVFSVFDPALTPPNKSTALSFTNTTQTFDIQPPLTVVKGGIYGLRLDLDVRHSIGRDAQGNLTGDALPAVTVTPMTPDLSKGFGPLQDLKGFVLSVTNGSTLSQYIGSVNVQLLSGTASVPVVPVNITPDTLINGQLATRSDVAAILGGSFVEIDGFVNAQGSLVANALEVEDQVNALQSRVGIIGFITSITRDATGRATQFNFYVSDEQPESLFVLDVDTIAQVEVTSTTSFHTSSRPVNFASLPFDATSLQVGQQVIVHGTVARGGGSVFNVTADSIYVALQTPEGNFSSAVQVGSDDKTGAFWFRPCAAIFQGLPILVLTNGDTAFVNVTGLSGLTSLPDLIVKGLAFYEQQGGTINGVSVPAGTLVMLADQVRQLP